MYDARHSLKRSEWTPNLQRLVKSAMPGYRKHSVNLVVTEQVQPFGWWWDGGSRSEYSTGTGYTRANPWSPPSWPTTDAPPLAVSANRWVLEGGTFMGKPRVLRFYVSKDFARALLGGF